MKSRGAAWGGCVAIAALLAGCAHAAADTASPASQPVRWIDRPAPPYHPGGHVLRYETSATPCQARQLRVSRARGGVGLGHVLDRFSFRNTSSSTCLATGFPAVTAIGEGGKRVRLRVRRNPSGTYFGVILAADIDPGHTAQLDLDTEDVTCDIRPRRAYRAVAFILPGGGTVRSQLELGRACGHWQMSRLGRPQRIANGGAVTPGGPGHLRVSWSVGPDTSARPGEVLHYVVTLRNPTATAIPLSPCPAYTEALSWDGGTAARTLFLNCAAVPVVEPRQSVRYRMVLRIPRQAAGAGKLVWRLDVPGDPPGEAAQLTVTG